MRCPQCGRPLGGAVVECCPSCGLPLTGVVAVVASAGATEEHAAGAPGGDSAPATGVAGPPPVAAASRADLGAAPPAATPTPPSGYQQFPPRGAPPGYMPGYGAPSYPMPGVPPGSPPGYAPYPGAPSGYPPGAPAPWGAPPAPAPRRSRAGIFIALGVTALALVLGGSVVAVLALRTPGGLAGAAPTATAAGTPAPTATPAPNVIYYDTMTDNAPHWLADGAHCFFGGDGYHIKGGYICYAPVDDLANLDVAVQVKQIAGTSDYSHGIVFRRASKGNYYEFGITNDGEWAVLKVKDGTATKLVPYVANSAIISGAAATNTLRVRAVGAHFDFFVNSTQVGQADDNELAAGLIGLSGGGDPSAEVVFTDVQIGIPG